MDQTYFRVVMIDDQVSFVDAFGLALSLTDDLKLVGRATNAVDGLTLSTERQPDLVVTDYRLPNGRTGTDLASDLRAAGFTKPILVLTGFLAPQVCREVEQLHDVTAVSKDTSVLQIVTTMRSILRGGDHDAGPVLDLDTGLSSAELEVLEALNTGAGPTEIAEMLHLSVHTVRGRIKSVYRKLSVGSLGEAVAKATRLGVLVPPR